MKVTCLLAILAVPALATAADDLAAHKSFFGKYCIQCHGAGEPKGDVRLDKVAAVDAAVWEDVYEQLASESMPPENKPQPSKSERRAAMEFALGLAKKDANATSTGFRRLNKREYGNTVRDLLGLRNGTFDPGEYIYDDEVDEGFDTQAESLVISNELLLEYLGASEKSLRQALFTPDRERPVPHVVNVNLLKLSGTSRRYINNDADYAIMRSGGNAQLYDGEKSRTMKRPGRYTITVTASGIDRDAYPVRFQPVDGPIIMGFGIQQDTAASVSGIGVLLKTFELKDDEEQTFTIDSWIDKDHFPYFSFVNGSSKPITQVRANIRRRKLKPSAMREPYAGPGIKITQLRIEGPFHDKWPAESLRATFDADDIPDLSDKAAREQLILRFARRAFRRSVTAEEVVPYLSFVNKQHASSGDWHESIIKTFAAMMTSADFLYIRERSGKLDSYELANRLSYFFWSTMPDDELFALANSGRLREPAMIRQQVERLLDDERSTRFADSFADQWLALDTLGSMPPDIKNPEFRDYFRDNLETAMLEETRRYFRRVLRENRSVRDFLDSDYSFVNKGLAKLYGVPFQAKDGNEFRRVTFGPEAKRGGLLGHASILTLSANGVETSPIERGVWVLADLLGTPPPPPPKAVPALTPDLNGSSTVRDMLERHRSDPACMECHRRMDPLGFALEAYDPIGRFRTKYSKTQAVSTHGNYLGKDFADVTELKRILSRDVRPFARSLVIRIAEYAKGRRLVAADYTTVESILEDTGENDFQLRDIVVAIATSNLMTNK